MKIKWKIEECISPLDTIKHPPELINISSGKINSDKSVNAEDAALIGEKQIQTFTKNLPESFHLSLTTEENVKPMVPNRKKSIVIEEKEVYDTEAIFARVIGLLAVGHLTLEPILKHELSALPTSLFKDDGDMRIDKGKSKLMNKLKVEVSIHCGWQCSTGLAR